MCSEAVNGWRRKEQFYREKIAMSQSQISQELYPFILIIIIIDAPCTVAR